MPFHINKVRYSFDYEKLDVRYDVFCMALDANAGASKKDRKHFSPASKIFDTVVLCKRVCSLLHARRGSKAEGAWEEDKNRIYVLMEKAIGNAPDGRKLLAEAIAGLPESQYVSIHRRPLRNLPGYVLLQLLLNTLSRYDEDLKANNLAGHLYCFNPKWVRHEKTKSGKTARKIVALEVRVTPDDKLVLNVRTFSSVGLRDHMKFTKKRPFETYAQYVLSNNFTLRPSNKADDKDEKFILKQTKNAAKSSIPFLSFHDDEDYRRSKMGLLDQVMDTLHGALSDGAARFELETVTDYTSLRAKSGGKMMTEIVSRIADYLREHRLKIVDAVSDERSADICEEIRRILRDEYGVEARVGVRFDRSAKALNIRLIHDAEYYTSRRMDDPYDRVPEGIAVQHITVENDVFIAVGQDAPKQGSTGTLTAVVRNVVQNLVIKDDLRQGRIQLYDWASLGFEGKVAFLVPYDEDEKRRYFCLDIYPDGSFTVEEKEYNPFGLDEYAECVSILAADSGDKTIRGVVMFPGGDVNVIRDTSLFPVPDIRGIAKRLENGDNRLKNRESRETLMDAILDIKGWRGDSAMYYCAGTIGEGMHGYAVKHAEVIREVKPHGDSRLLFDRLLPTMNVIFVRNGQLTVFPFPFKYLREYIKTREATCSESKGAGSSKKTSAQFSQRLQPCPCGSMGV